METVQNSLKSSDPKQFWAYVNKKKDNSRILGVVKHNNLEYKTPVEIVDSL